MSLTDHERITIDRAADRFAAVAGVLGALAEQHAADPQLRAVTTALAGRADLLDLLDPTPAPVSESEDA